MERHPRVLEVCPLIEKLREWIKEVGAACREAVAGLLISLSVSKKLKGT